MQQRFLCEDPMSWSPNWETLVRLSVRSQPPHKRLRRNTVEKAMPAQSRNAEGDKAVVEEPAASSRTAPGFPASTKASENDDGAPCAVAPEHGPNEDTAEWLNDITCCYRRSHDEVNNLPYYGRTLHRDDGSDHVVVFPEGGCMEMQIWV